MFTKKEFTLAKKLYLPIKVIDLCRKHRVGISFNPLGGNYAFYLGKGNLNAAIVVYEHNTNEEILYAIEKAISQLNYEIEKRTRK